MAWTTRSMRMKRDPLTSTLPPCAASASAHAAATHFGDMAALQAAVLAQAAQGGSVLVKGSRFMRMERVVHAMLEQSSAQEAACS